MRLPTKAELKVQIQELTDANAVLQANLDEGRRDLVELKVVRQHLDTQVKGLHAELQSERVWRVAAQRGLVPYVRGLEAFDGWLRSHPQLRKQLEQVLRTNGLWEIKLGYDPHEDISTSVLSPSRMPPGNRA